ncbi:MAG TPA: galactose oxidase [Bacteroidales bacterium]|nr:galactose oxidase [Bacteroidales bacterium]
MRNSGFLFLVSLLLIFQTHISNAQNMKGIVLEAKSNKPIAAVNVFLKALAIGTTTDEKGEFQFKYVSKINDKDTLYFSIIGYETKKIPFSELKGDNLRVLLSENVLILNEVTITSNRQLKQQIEFKKLAPLKGGLYSFGSVLIENKIWIIGGDESYESGGGLKIIAPVGGTNNMKMNSNYSWEGYSDKLHLYDMQENKWTTSSLKFSKRAYHNINYYNDKIYVLGGKRLSTNRKFEYLDDKIEVYDIKKNSILIANKNPHQAVNFASFVYNDNLIVIGGSIRRNINEEKECSNKVHLLNLKTGLWYELKDMPVAKETTGVIGNHIIYLIGGFNSKPLDNIETYNITTGEWKIEGQLFDGVERPAVAYNDNIIYIFEDGKIQTYNVETKQLNMYSIDLPLNSCEMFYANNTLYILGGFMKTETTEVEGSSTAPSSDLYSIDLREFNRAVIYDSKNF